jgi:hypothetical protein
MSYKTRKVLPFYNFLSQTNCGDNQSKIQRLERPSNGCCATFLEAKLKLRGLDDIRTYFASLFSLALRLKPFESINA